MEPIWFKEDLADEIMKNNDLIYEMQNIVTGIEILNSIILYIS